MFPILKCHHGLYNSSALKSGVHGLRLNLRISARAKLIMSHSQLQGNSREGRTLDICVTTQEEEGQRKPKQDGKERREACTEE